MNTIQSALPSETPTLRGNEEFEGAEHHVDVAEAEREFNALARELSRRPRSRSRSRVRSVKRRWRIGKSDGGERDVEKLGDKEEVDEDELDDGEPFDLRTYLTSSNDKHQAAGIKHKHVGVTWEDLQVDVFGGADHKVCTIYFLKIA